MVIQCKASTCCPSQNEMDERRRSKEMLVGRPHTHQANAQFTTFNTPQHSERADKCDFMNAKQRSAARISNSQNIRRSSTHRPHAISTHTHSACNCYCYSPFIISASSLLDFFADVDSNYMVNYAENFNEFHQKWKKKIRRNYPNAAQYDDVIRITASLTIASCWWVQSILIVTSTVSNHLFLSIKKAIRKNQKQHTHSTHKSINRTAAKLNKEFQIESKVFASKRFQMCAVKWADKNASPKSISPTTY